MTDVPSTHAPAQPADDEDQSTNFAIYAIVLFLLAWVVIPGIIYQVVK